MTQTYLRYVEQVIRARHNGLLFHSCFDRRDPRILCETIEEVRVAHEVDVNH